MIRSIHPFYLLGLMVVVLVTLVWQNAKIQEEISSEMSERVNAKIMAKRIIDLKKVMKSPDKSQLDRFLEGSAFAGSELSHRIKNGQYVIDAKHMNAGQLQSFLNRILNMNVEVTQLKIETQDDKHVSVNMEIRI